MADIIVGPGSNTEAGYTTTPTITSPPVVKVTVPGKTGTLSLPQLKDVKVTASNDEYSWTQLNVAGKRKIATTSTNSVSTNIVVDNEVMFGNVTATSGSASNLGIWGLSKNKTQVDITVNVGSTVIAATASITGLDLAISADQPIWETPITFSVNGDFGTPT